MEQRVRLKKKKFFRLGKLHFKSLISIKYEKPVYSQCYGTRDLSQYHPVGRLDHQPLFGKGARASLPTVWSGEKRESERVAEIEPIQRASAIKDRQSNNGRSDRLSCSLGYSTAVIFS